MNPSVLITGASGFIGRNLAARLSAAGYFVRGASRGHRSLPGCSETRSMPPPDAAHEEFDALLDGVDHVVHCAGIARTLASETLERFIEVNAGLTEALARRAYLVPGRRFLFLSSIRAVCGPSVPGVVDEDTPPDPREDYGRSKLEAERRLAGLYGSDPRLTILRPTLVYGEGMGGLLPALSRLAALPLPLPFGAVTAARSLLDVDALAHAVRHLLEASSAIGGTFNICDARPVTTAEIITALRRRRNRRARLFRVPPPLLEKGLSVMGRHEAWLRLGEPLVADPSRLAATGWQPAEDTARRLSNYLLPGNRPDGL